ncbi:MAG: hypothetical protein AAGJ56_02835 [Myxococcota bacterium]
MAQRTEVLSRPRSEPATRRTLAWPRVLGAVFALGAVFVSGCGDGAVDGGDRFSQPEPSEMNIPGSQVPDENVAEPVTDVSPDFEAELVWRRSLSFDSDSLRQPTNGMRLAGHEGALFVGLGSDNDLNDANQGRSYVYRLDRPGDDWVVDVEFPPGTGRVADLRDVRFESDLQGRVLSEPMRLLVAGTNQGAGTALLRVRRDGQWSNLDLGLEPSPNSRIRAIGFHRDATTGVDGLFVGVSPGGLVRVVADPQSESGLRVDSAPEFEGDAGDEFGKWFGFATANGSLFAASRNGIFRRVDGELAAGESRWSLVIELPRLASDGLGENNLEYRGLTAVPSVGFPEDEMLVFYQQDTVWRARAGGNYETVVELDLNAAIGDAIGYPVALAEGAFNPLSAIRDGWIIGVEFVFGSLDEDDLVPPLDPDVVGSMNDETAFSRVAMFFRRREDGTYSAPESIRDPTDPNRSLILARDVVASPFVDDDGGVYTTGFNASSAVSTGDTSVNGAAWVYRGDFVDALDLQQRCDAERYPGAQGPYAVGSRALTVQDVERDREIPVQVYFPVGATGTRPVFVWSHGGGPLTTQDPKINRGVELLEVLAASGWVTIQLRHPPADVDEACARTELGAACPITGDDSLLMRLTRPLDVSSVVDGRSQIQAVLPVELSEPPFAMGGHSNGSYTTMSLAGAPSEQGGAVQDFSDPRFDVFVAASPQGPDRFGFSDESWDGLVAPTLFLTGEGDVTGIGPENRRIPFDVAPGDDQALFFVEDPAFGHDAFSFNTNNDLTELMVSTVSAFLDRARGRNQPVASCFLSDEAVSVRSDGDARLETR